MLFAVTFTPRPTVTEASEKRVLSLFTNWKPPAGYEFKALYDYADAEGGVAIVEADSPEALLEAHAVFSAYFSFQARPVVAADKATPIFTKTHAWRDTIR